MAKSSSGTICEREILIGQPIEDEHYIRTAKVRAYIYYNDHIYSLNLAHGRKEFRKPDQFNPNGFEANSMELAYFGGRGGQIGLTWVQRKSAKVEKELEAWFNDNFDGLVNAYLWGNTDNVYSLMEYCKAHKAECFHLDAFNYKHPFKQMECTHPEYIPLTGCWTNFLIADTNLDMIKAEYDKDKEEFKSDYKKMTELIIAVNWMCNRWYAIWQRNGSKEDGPEYIASKQYNDMYKEMLGLCDDMCEGNTEIAEYYFDMTD